MADILYLSGDATSPVGDGQKIIAHCCNSIGMWSYGFVASLSRRWKGPETQYRRWHKSHNAFSLGNVQFVRVEDDILVANIIGQRGVKPHGGVPPIRYGAIRRGLKKVARKALKESASVHMPRMSSIRGDNVWEEVEEIIKTILSDQGISVYVYDFDQGNTRRKQTPRLVPQNRKAPRWTTSKVRRGAGASFA